MILRAISYGRTIKMKIAYTKESTIQKIILGIYVKETYEQIDVRKHPNCIQVMLLIKKIQIHCGTAVTTFYIPKIE